MLLSLWKNNKNWFSDFEDNSDWDLEISDNYDNDNHASEHINSSEMVENIDPEMTEKPSRPVNSPAIKRSKKQFVSGF